MEKTILDGVGKKIRNAYFNGQLSEDKILFLYKKNKKEADSFSVFGYKEKDIVMIMQETHNPLLRQKLMECLNNKREISIRSNSQNEINLKKLEDFKKNACGVGLRKVLKRLKKLSKTTKDLETLTLLLLLETEFANLSAKKHKGELKKLIYERKSILLYQLADCLEELGWKYGINDNAGKNACYLVYVYLPNGVQLTWHCNEYSIYSHYPTIEAIWDGQVCMTMDKILTYISSKYYELQQAA